LAGLADSNTLGGNDPHHLGDYAELAILPTGPLTYAEQARMLEFTRHIVSWHEPAEGTL
jgi:hypothetical protein